MRRLLHPERCLEPTSNSRPILHYGSALDQPPAYADYCISRLRPQKQSPACADSCIFMRCPRPTADLRRLLHLPAVPQPTSNPRRILRLPALPLTNHRLAPAIASHALPWTNFQHSSDIASSSFAVNQPPTFIGYCICQRCLGPISDSGRKQAFGVPSRSRRLAPTTASTGCALDQPPTFIGYCIFRLCPGSTAGLRLLLHLRATP